jgi:hypothetical protein
MKLLTQEIKAKLAKRPLYSTEKTPEVLSIVKFFTPTSSFTWHVWEFDGEDTFFGFVTSHLSPDGEWGYFSLSELSTVKGPFGLGVERDLYYKPISKKEVK